MNPQEIDAIDALALKVKAIESSVHRLMNDLQRLQNTAYRSASRVEAASHAAVETATAAAERIKGTNLKLE